MRDLLKFLSDLTRTKYQITYLVMGLVTWVTALGAARITTVADAATLLGALMPIVLIVLGAWLGDKKIAPPGNG